MVGHSCCNDGTLAEVLLVGGAVGSVLKEVRKIQRNQEEIMARFDALNAKLDEHRDALDAAVARVDEDVQALKDEIAALQLDADDQAAVDAAADRVQASIDQLKTLDPVTAPVEEEPVDEPPAEPTA